MALVQISLYTVSARFGVTTDKGGSNLMTNYREILRLKSLGFSERNIALSCSVSRNTVSRVVQAASKRNISWPLDFDMTDKVLER